MNRLLLDTCIFVEIIQQDRNCSTYPPAVKLRRGDDYALWQVCAQAIILSLSNSGIIAPNGVFISIATLTEISKCLIEKMPRRCFPHQDNYKARLAARSVVQGLRKSGLKFAEDEIVGLSGYSVYKLSEVAKSVKAAYDAWEKDFNCRLDIELPDEYNIVLSKNLGAKLVTIDVGLKQGYNDITLYPEDLPVRNPPKGLKPLQLGGDEIEAILSGNLDDRMREQIWKRCKLG